MVHKKNRDLEQELARCRENNAALLDRLERCEAWGKDVKAANDGLAEEHALLTESLAAAEAHFQAEQLRGDAAEARVRELEALVGQQSTEREHWKVWCQASESSLAAATALIRRFTSNSDSLTEYCATYTDAIAFLANQPATPSSEAAIARAAMLVDWTGAMRMENNLPFDLLKLGTVVLSHVAQQQAAPSRELLGQLGALGHATGQTAAPLPGWDDIERKTAPPTRTDDEKVKATDQWLRDELALQASVARQLRSQAPTRTEACDECGTIHGPGNTNTLCSRASNYRGLGHSAWRNRETRTEAERRLAAYYCPQCGVLHHEEDGDGNTVSCIEQDGACRFCGCDTVSWPDLLDHLSAAGWTVNGIGRTEAEQRVLDAATRMKFSNDGCDCIEIEDDGGLPEAELARRLAEAVSDSYCKGCRDSEAGCERCLPAREERARRNRLAEAEQAVLDAMERADIYETADGRAEFAKFDGGRDACRAELARRWLK